MQNSKFRDALAYCSYTPEALEVFKLPLVSVKSVLALLVELVNPFWVLSSLCPFLCIEWGHRDVLQLCCLAVQSQRFGGGYGTVTHTGTALEGKDGKGNFIFI